MSKLRKENCVKVKDADYPYDKFIRIEYIVSCDDDGAGWLYEKRNYGYDKSYLLDTRETYINVEYIQEITPVVKEEYYIKNYNDNNFTTREYKIFQIFMSDGKRFYLLEKEFKKFNNILNG